MTPLDLFIIAMFFFVAFTVWWYATIPPNLPPGPPGLPLIGSTLDTWHVSTYYKNLCNWAREYGSVYKMYIGNQLVVVLGDYEAINDGMIKQGDVYAGRPPFHVIFPEGAIGKGLTSSEGELWKTQRRFALSTLRDFGFGRPIIEPQLKDEAEHLLEAIAMHKGKPFNMKYLMGGAVSNVVCSLVFGKRFPYDDEQFQEVLGSQRLRMPETNMTFLTPMVYSKTLADMLGGVPIVKQLQNAGAHLMVFIKRQASGAVEDFRVETDEPTNYIQAYRKAQYEHRNDSIFTDVQLFASLANLFIAGTDTSSTTLRWGIFYLCHYPDIQERVYQEISKEMGSGRTLLNYADRSKLPYCEAVLLEIQRMGQILPTSLFRRTTVPSKLRGYDIPVGTVVVPLTGASMSDPIVYPNPYKFDPERFMNQEKDAKVFSYLIPFSAGKRICLGESLAKMELFIFFTALFSRYRFYFSPDEPEPPLEKSYGLLRSPAEHKICAELRSD